MRRARSNSLWVVCLPLMVALLAPSPVDAAGTSILTYGHVGGGFQNLSYTTDNGSTTVTSPQHRWEYSANITPGVLDGQGVGDFGQLKASVLVDGLSADYGGCRASATDYWTVTHPTLNGTEGTMQLAFDVTGSVTVLDYASNPLLGDASFASVMMDVAVNDAPVLQMNESVATGSVAFMGVAGSPTVSAAFTFTYGTPFKLSTAFEVYGNPDNHFLYASFNPTYYAHWGGGTVSRVFLDFMNTASLSTIAIGGYDGQTGLQTESGADHESLMGAVIIPEPASLALLGLGGLLVARRRRC